MPLTNPNSSNERKFQELLEKHDDGIPDKPEQNQNLNTVSRRMYTTVLKDDEQFNPLNAELNPIRHLLALVGARHIVHFSRIRDKSTVKLPYNDIAGTVYHPVIYICDE